MMWKAKFRCTIKKKGTFALTRLVEPEGRIRENMIYMGASYQSIVQERSSLINAYEIYLEFIQTFKHKAIGDCIDTMQRQYNARLELDGYGSKLGQLEEKKLKYLYFIQNICQNSGNFRLGHQISRT